jgi:phospholipid/cholesterol/gamma-HCH transport system substrate-binding protein
LEKQTYNPKEETEVHLKPDAGVRYLGVDVGRVVDVRVDRPRQKVSVTIRIDSKTDLRKDAVLIVSSQGLLGEALLEVVDAGQSQERAGEGDILRAQPQGDLRRLVSKVDISLDELIDAARALKEVDDRLERVEHKLDALLARSAAR